MSIARINMVEWRSEEEFLEISEQYNKESAKTFVQGGHERGESPSRSSRRCPPLMRRNDCLYEKHKTLADLVFRV